MNQKGDEMGGSQVDINDQSGSTVHWSGTVSSSPTTFNSPSNRLIGTILIVPETSNKLEISFDGGTNYFPVEASLVWSPKQVSSILVKSSSGNVAFHAIINIEDY